MRGCGITAATLWLCGVALGQSAAAPTWVPAAPSAVVDSTGTVPLAGWLAGLVPLGHGALAAGEGGVWLSTGGSAGWSALGDGRAATALAASSDGSVIYAAIGPGVIASRDGGQTWGPSGGNGLPANLTLQRLAVDAATLNHLLIAGDGRWASSDGGSSGIHASKATGTDPACRGSREFGAA